MLDSRLRGNDWKRAQEDGRRARVYTRRRLSEMEATDEREY